MGTVSNVGSPLLAEKMKMFTDLYVDDESVSGLVEVVIVSVWCRKTCRWLSGSE